MRSPYIKLDYHLIHTIIPNITFSLEAFLNSLAALSLFGKRCFIKHSFKFFRPKKLLGSLIRKFHFKAGYSAHSFRRDAGLIQISSLTHFFGLHGKWKVYRMPLQFPHNPVFQHRHLFGQQMPTQEVSSMCPLTVF